MQIDKHIENALYLYQCVIVPGFGGFIALETPSEDRTDPDKYAPEKKHFTFNPLLKVNDGVLGMHIAHTRDISYAEAMDEIARAVDFYLALLEKGDTVDIEGVGSIVPGENGLMFTPYGTKDFCREQYGLASTVVRNLSQPQEGSPADNLSHAHPEIQAAPRQDAYTSDSAQNTPGDAETMRQAADILENDAADDTAAERPPIDKEIEALLTKAAEKATLEKFRDNEVILRSLLTSAAEKARLSTDDPNHHQVIESIVQALTEEAVATDEALQTGEPADGIDESVEETVEETVEQAPYHAPNESAGAEDSDDDNSDDPPHFWNRKTVRATIGALIVVAALAGLFFFVYRSGANLYFWKDDAPKKDVAVLPAERPDTLAVPPASDTLTVPPVENTSYRHGDALQTDYLADKPFYVIAAAVAVKANAARALDELRAKGYPAEYAGYHHGLYLVAYRGFCSRERAMEMRDSLEKTDNRDVWIKVYNRNADKKTD